MSAEVGKNKFALMPKQSSAVEKAEPGAKRILSSMVADTLAIIPERLIAETEVWVEKGNRCFDLGARQRTRELAAKHYAEAASWYRKAAERNHAKAQCYLGHCYVSGWGVAEDKVEGIRWFQKSAELGDVSAQRWLGDFYERVEEYASAIKWYRKGAEKGDFSCQYELGNCYRDGKGLAKDQIEAVKWYRKAAQQNLSTAQYALGCCYRDGQGVMMNDNEAVKWFVKAANQGHRESQNLLGVCHTEGGFGIQRDYAEAFKWFTLADEQGDKNAPGWLATLRHWMSPEDITEGERRIGAFRAQKDFHK